MQAALADARTALAAARDELERQRVAEQAAPPPSGISSWSARGSRPSWSASTPGGRSGRARWRRSIPRSRRRRRSSRAPARGWPGPSRPTPRRVRPRSRPACSRHGSATGGRQRTPAATALEQELALWCERAGAAEARLAGAVDSVARNSLTSSPASSRHRRRSASSGPGWPPGWPKPRARRRRARDQIAAAEAAPEARRRRCWIRPTLRGSRRARSPPGWRPGWSAPRPNVPPRRPRSGPVARICPRRVRKRRLPRAQLVELEAELARIGDRARAARTGQSAGDRRGARADAPDRDPADRAGRTCRRDRAPAASDLDLEPRGPRAPADRVRRGRAPF